MQQIKSEMKYLQQHNFQSDRTEQRPNILLHLLFLITIEQHHVFFLNCVLCELRNVPMAPVWASHWKRQHVQSSTSPN